MPLGAASYVLRPCSPHVLRCLVAEQDSNGAQCMPLGAAPNVLWPCSLHSSAWLQAETDADVAMGDPDAGPGASMGLLVKVRLV